MKISFVMPTMTPVDFLDIYPCNSELIRDKIILIFEYMSTNEGCASEK